MGIGVLWLLGKNVSPLLDAFGEFGFDAIDMLAAFWVLFLLHTKPILEQHESLFFQIRLLLPEMVLSPLYDFASSFCRLELVVIMPKVAEPDLDVSRLSKQSFKKL